MDGEVVLNNDGSVSVYMLNNVGALAPVILTQACCTALGKGYTFDIDTQKCMWKSPTSACGIDEVFKVVLNPKGNDGTIFYSDETETCQLGVDFKYLFKVNCSSLSQMLKKGGKKVGEIVEIVTPVEYVQTKEELALLQQIKEQEALCEKYSYTIIEISKSIAETPYSIECTAKAYEPTPVKVDASITKSFSRTAFSTNRSIAPFSFDLTDNAVGTFCLTEPDGLAAWEKILGPVRYQQFLNGDPNSYSCVDVQTIVTQNLNGVLKNEPALIYDCAVPFGTKTNLIKQYNEAIALQAECQKYLEVLQGQVKSVNAEPIGTVTVGQQTFTSNCASPIDFFESFNVSMTVDVVTSANTLETVYEQQLFGPIGSGNLYNYLVSAGTSSGFYVCGEPNANETLFNGCVPMLFDYDDDTIVNNVSACQTVMTNILTGLYQQSGLSAQTNGQETFQENISISALTSNWLQFSTLITDPTVIEQIVNKKIKVSFKINHTCGDFCILVDEISLNKICSKVTENNIFITKSPGFELERIRDNKKSWIDTTTPVNRAFDIKNNVGTNPIRQTNYDVNDERLVINTKEIDLDINIASGVETDVWCYIVDNPCILSATCIPLEISCPAGYTLMGDNTTCQKIEYTAVTTGATVYTSVAGAKRCDSIVTYGENGGVFYPDLTTLNLPLNVTGGSIHVQSVVVDSLNNIVPIEATVLNSVWGNGPGSCGIYPCSSACTEYNYRINKIGLWTSPDAPPSEWVGWSFCVNIPSTGVYTIGVAADDACRVKVNGNLTFSFDGAGWNFLAFRMFPITLSAGLNIIEMEISNFGGGSATLAAEIYSASTSVISGITSESELLPYIVFSTGDYLGQNWQTGEDSGFSCPSGYALNTCDNPYTCVKISKAEATVIGDCCDPCAVYSASCGNKSFQDDECFLFQDSEVYEFMDGNYTQYPALTLNGSNCCGDEIDFNQLLTQPLSAVTTIEDFKYFLTSELIDAKNRQTISGYPTLKALYNRYLNSLDYCETKSSAFNYMTMDQFAGLIDSYWVDIVEQVIPATTIWGSVKVYSNTIFDQQKFKYKSYSSLLCGNPYSGKTISSPINGKTGQCASVEVISTTVVQPSPNMRIKPTINVCDSICLAQMNMGSEFIGTVTVIGAEPVGCDVSNGTSINECTLQATVTTTYPHATVNVIGAAGSVSYLWSNSETGQTATFLTAGTYSVTVTDSNCCEFSVEFYMPEPQLAACWYSMQENPSYVHFGLVCDGSEFSSITFTLSSMVVNGEELVTSPYTKTINSGTTNFVYANNTNLSGCTLGSPTGMTYTDFVDLLNEAFVGLGLPYYHAQLSYTNKVVYDAINQEVVNPAGFYIIRPASDTFSIKTSSDIGSPINLIYSENAVTNWAGSPTNYYAMTCDGITLENNTVIE